MDSIDEFKAAQARLLARHGVDAESQYVSVPAVQGSVHVLRTGHGPAVVLVPGFADPAAMWAPLLARLDGFTTFAVDRPCFGLTGRAESSTSSFRRLAVSFLEQVLDALGLEGPPVVGNSLGSLWSTWLALDRPDRVAALVHVGCPALVLGTSAPLPMRLLSVPGLGRLLMSLSPPSPRQVEAFGRRMAGEDLGRHPELRDLLVAAQRLPGAPESIRELLRAVLRLRGARPPLGLTEDQLARVRQPVRLVWGEDDAFGGPRVAKQVARLLPDATLRLVPGGGHVPWIGHPEEVAAAVGPFLREHPGAG